MAKVKVRIKFSADLVIEADSLEQAREKWDGLPLFTEDAEDCGVEYNETLLVEDAESYKDISHEWNKL